MLASQESHEISVELETTVGVRSAEELLWGWYWCRYAFKQIWAQAKIVVPLCLYVATFKDGVLHGTTGTSLTHARVHALAHAWTRASTHTYPLTLSNNTVPLCCTAPQLTLAC